jgi:hypothetical protein
MGILMRRVDSKESFLLNLACRSSPLDSDTADEQVPQQPRELAAPMFYVCEQPSSREEGVMALVSAAPARYEHVLMAVSKVPTPVIVSPSSNSPFRRLEPPDLSTNMDATLDLVAKEVYQEGTGLSIGQGDHVTVKYSGIWFDVENEASGIQ